MTRNPYAHPDTFEPEPAAQRVSMLAVSSLVFGILCCVPFFGLIAVILGGAGMVAISRSEGRLTGRGLALAGLILGLLGIIWTGLLTFGTLQATSQVQSMSGSYSFVEQKDYTGFRNLLSPSVSQQLTDEQIDQFREKVTAAWGKNLGPTKGIGEIMGSYSEVFQRTPGAQQPGDMGLAMPVPLKFEKGMALAYIELDENQPTTRGTPAILNIMVLDQSGNPIYLRPPAGGAPPAPPGTPTPPGGQNPPPP